MGKLRYEVGLGEIVHLLVRNVKNILIFTIAVAFVDWLCAAAHLRGIRDDRCKVPSEQQYDGNKCAEQFLWCIERTV